MRLVNNKLYITKGETPTFECSVVDKDTRCPFLLLEDFRNPVIEFSVKPSIYTSRDNYTFKVYMPYKDETRFKTAEIFDYTEVDTTSNPMWDNNKRPEDDKIAIVDGETGLITNAHIYSLYVDGSYEYRYYNDDIDPDDEESINKYYPYGLPEGVTLGNCKWYPYEFIIAFNFPYADGFTEDGKRAYGGTSEFEVKTYQYEITLFDVTSVIEKDGEFILQGINYKKPILEANDFIVGGSVSE